MSRQQEQLYVSEIKWMQQQMQMLTERLNASCILPGILLASEPSLGELHPPSLLQEQNEPSGISACIGPSEVRHLGGHDHPVCG